MSLPGMLYGSGIGKYNQTSYGGYNHNLSAMDGQIYDMTNMSSDYAPLLSPRAQRYITRTLVQPNGLYANDGLYWVDGTAFYADGVSRGTVSAGRKTFAALGAYIIIMPDMACYNKLTGEFGSLNASWTGAAQIVDGTYGGETAKSNTIEAAGVDFTTLFKAGDGITISGATVHPENNKTIIVREVTATKLVFYENSFMINDGGDSETALTLSREMPEIDYLCENENRLWGCKGDTIYASKLGDPTNWNVFDGLSTDSYAVQVGSAGDFTACCSYLGYAIFFKEEMIYKVYGSAPSNFQVMGSASLGVEAGSSLSLAIAGETLFFLTRAGIVAYSGGTTQSVASAFGLERYHNAVAGSDGLKYYVSMQNEAGDWNLFAYDTRLGIWEREDDTQALGFAWDSNLYFLDADGTLWLNGRPRTVPDGATLEDPVQSMVEFGEFVDNDPNKKQIAKLQVRISIDAGASVTFWMMFDSSGEWEEISTIESQVLRSYYLPLVPRRCDHYKIKITGIGGWRLYSMTREDAIGSELRSTPGRQ